MESSRIFWLRLYSETSVFTTCRCITWVQQAVPPSPSIRRSIARQRTYVNPASLALIVFFPSPFSSRAANNISRPTHIATQQIRADKTWNCCFDCGSIAPHFHAHSSLQQRGREVQPASVFRFVDPVIASASLFFSLLSSVWEPKQQKGQNKGEPPWVFVGTVFHSC